MMRSTLMCFLPLLAVATALGQQPDTLPYKNPSLPVAQRVQDLVSRMTLEEKVSQIGHTAEAIPRLGVPEYNWWNEGLHGVARAGVATVFPQAIGLAATFDEPLIHHVASTVGTEFRAKYNETLHKDGSADSYRGLTVWSPNINIFRDPRWGRGQETYGEDPYLTSRMGVAFVTGLQGDDPRYLKTIATPKHFAVHSGPETTRHQVDVKASLHDMEDTYLPAFRATVVDAKAQSVMCAYNSLNGQPACANTDLLQEHLRRDWKFKGYVVSDCGAVTDILNGHHYATSIEEAAADAMKAGTDLFCDWPLEGRVGFARSGLLTAAEQGLLPVAALDLAVTRLFTARFQLGMFDPPAMVPYSRIKPAENDTDAHRQLALRTAQESLVLLKNQDNLLPLRNSYGTIAVIGPDADNLDALVGNYNGTPSKPVTILAGIRRRFPQSKVLYAEGTGLLGPASKAVAGQEGQDAIDAAKNADLVIVALGLSPTIEGEEMHINAEGFAGGDRTNIDLPAPQERLLERIGALGKPVVLLLLNGSALGVNWADKNVPAIIEAWYPGEEGGTAVAQALAGDFSPGGRLPVTFYKSVDQLPPFDDYSMAKRTYRYFDGEPLYPFGYGLSYTTFEYTDARVLPATIDAQGSVTLSANVRNTGKLAGDEVVQLYLTHARSSNTPIRALQGFQRVHLEVGQQKTVMFKLDNRKLRTIDEAGKQRINAGSVEVWIGGGQPVARPGTTKPSGILTRFVINGDATFSPN
jgi:beta-glucosidase